MRDMWYKVLFCLVLSIGISVAMPNAIPVKVEVYNTTNDAWANKDVNISLRLYNVQNGGAVLYEQNTSETTDFNGHIFKNMTNCNINFNQDLWLEIHVNNETVVPRTKINTIPYAYMSNTTGSVNIENVTGLMDALADRLNISIADVAFLNTSDQIYNETGWALDLFLNKSLILVSPNCTTGKYVTNVTITEANGLVITCDAVAVTENDPLWVANGTTILANISDLNNSIANLTTSAQDVWIALYSVNDSLYANVSGLDVKILSINTSLYANISALDAKLDAYIATADVAFLNISEQIYNETAWALGLFINKSLLLKSPQCSSGEFVTNVTITESGGLAITCGAAITTESDPLWTANASAIFSNITNLNLSVANLTTSAQNLAITVTTNNATQKSQIDNITTVTQSRWVTIDTNNATQKSQIDNLTTTAQTWWITVTTNNVTQKAEIDNITATTQAWWVTLATNNLTQKAQIDNLTAVTQAWWITVATNNDTQKSQIDNLTTSAQDLAITVTTNNDTFGTYTGTASAGFVNITGDSMSGNLTLGVGVNITANNPAARIYHNGTHWIIQG